MAHLVEQFDGALENVEPSNVDKENAPKCHLEVRAVLETSDDLQQLGIDTVLIGSYARHVSIRRMNDVDVFSKLSAADASSASPSALLDQFEEVLREGFGTDQVTRQRRSIQVAFPERELHVDAVPAVPSDGDWLIPDGDDGWQRTNPLRLGERSTEMNQAHTLGGRGVYVPVVKLVRQTRRASGIDQPGGLFFEIACYWSFLNRIDSGASHADYFAQALAGIGEELSSAASGGLPDPALPDQVITTKATANDIRLAADAVLDAASRASAALASSDECQAALAFQELLGVNEDGVVFPMPSHCNEDGTHKVEAAAIIAGDRRAPSGDDRFA